MTSGAVAKAEAAPLKSERIGVSENRVAGGQVPTQRKSPWAAHLLSVVQESRLLFLFLMLALYTP